MPLNLGRNGQGNFGSSRWRQCCSNAFIPNPVLARLHIIFLMDLEKRNRFDLCLTMNGTDLCRVGYASRVPRSIG